MTKVLAFDACNNALSTALIIDQELVSKNTILATSNQSEILILELEKILKKNKIWYQDLNLIAATQGPGSFTGIRISLAAARTLKISTNLPLILVNSLEVLAFKNRDYSGEIFAAIDAKMNEFFVAKFLSQKNQLFQIGDSQLMRFADILQLLPKTKFLLCGSAKKIIAEILADQKICFEIKDGEDFIEADSIAFLALEKFKQKDYSTAKQNLDAIYLRAPKITHRKR